MKHFDTRPYTDPAGAARKLLELAAGIEAVQDGRIPYREDQRAVPLYAERQRF